MTTVVVIGARRRRQGIGEFVARSFHEAGARVLGIVGTSAPTVEQARRALAERHGIEARGYLSVETALRDERPDVAAVCSPAEAHLEHLRAASEAGVHCLCEKPLWWGSGPDRSTPTIGIARAFAAQGRFLGLVTQWRFTLAAFEALHPRVLAEGISHFEMLLAPASRGPRMVLDSLSHPLSLLEALCGYGKVRRARVRFGGRHRSRADVTFGYRHAAGEVEAHVRLVGNSLPPRPAAFAVNGHRVEREIDLPAYEMYLGTRDRRVRLQDPLELLVEDFLRRVREGARPDVRGLVEGMRNLETLVLAAEGAAAPTEES